MENKTRPYFSLWFFGLIGVVLMIILLLSNSVLAQSINLGTILPFNPGYLIFFLIGMICFFLGVLNSKRR